MPWSAKAQDLLRRQYAPVGAAARAGHAAAVAALEAASSLGLDIGELLEAHRRRADLASRYTAAYRRYCWPVEGVGDLRLAPFHVMGGEGHVHAGRSHDWHMARAAELAEATRTLGASRVVPTATREVDLSGPASEAAATAWWEELTGRGAKGMVVKPMDFVARGTRGLVQPAVKCRGVEYLRIIYGPTTPRRPTWSACGRAGWGRSAHWRFGSSPLASRRWSASSKESPSAASTSASSPSSRSRASPSTPACSPGSGSLFPGTSCGRSGLLPG